MPISQKHKKAQKRFNQQMSDLISKAKINKKTKDGLHHSAD